MKTFFQNFFKKHKKEIISFSLLRIISFVQVLFWPFALSKVINIMAQDIQDWKRAMVWAGLMIINAILEHIFRLRSKLGLEMIATELQIKLTIFLSEKTRLKKGVKTGEAVQAIRAVSGAANSLILYYKENLLQLPVNLIIIPVVLLNANLNYLLILVIFAALYFLAENYFAKRYNQKLEKYLKASEIFWGTTYRKTPDVWRQRGNLDELEKIIEKQGRDLDNATDAFSIINNHRWMALQIISGAGLGGSVFYVLYRALKNLSPIGDLILVTSYFSQIHSSLNTISSTLSQIFQARLALDRLDKTLKINSDYK